VSKKKDYNTIAAVEKAIAKKYGASTVKDFRSTWDETYEKEYLLQLKDRNLKEKRKNNRQKKENRTCPVCKTYSFSARDDLYMNRFKCCYLCYVEFVERREEEWAEGKRPTEEQITATLKRRKNNG
tara:strand:+ start:290 stop:667 length:378 start_codon:yes stop_codon:yes gene_type:complete